MNANSPAREIAWHEFHKRYEPIIGAFARRMGARSQDIADIVQEVLLGFFAVSPHFIYDPARGRFRGYLKVCAWRVLRARVRKRPGIMGTVGALDQDELAVDAAWTDVWERERLDRAVEQVREQCSKRADRVRTFQAFELTVILELPVAEVADRLKMSTASVHQAKTRICKAIKVAMEELDEDLG